MHNIDIQEVGMENFGPYIDPMVLEFKNNSLTLLTGPNGCGKTTALDAIPFTFYNDTTKGAKGDDLVNNVTGKNCKTWVKFVVNDNDTYIVTRYQKYTRFGNTVILNKNKKDIKKGQREVLPVLEKLICSKRAFMNTLMFGQKVKDFFTDLVDSDKKLIFRELLSLILYEYYHKTSGELLKKNILELTNIENIINISIGLLEDTKIQIQTIENLKKQFIQNQKQDILILEKSIRDSEKIIKEWSLKSKKLGNQDIDFESTDEDIKKNDNKLEQLYNEETQQTDKIKHQQEQKLAEIQTKASNAKIEILQESKTKNENITKDITKYHKKMTDLDALKKEKEHKIELEISEINSDIKIWNQQIKEIEDNVLNKSISQCPTCKQKINESIIDSLKQKINVYNSQIVNAQDSINDIHHIFEKEYLKYKKEHVLINETLQKLQREQYSLQSKINKDTIDVTDRENKAIEALNELASKVIKECVDNFVIKKASLVEEKSQLIIIRDKQNGILEEINKIETTIVNIEKDIEQYQHQLKQKIKAEFDETQLKSYIIKEIDLKQKIKDNHLIIKTIKIQQKVLEFWKMGFSSSGIPSMLIDEAVPFMNQRVSHYLDKFTNGRYIVSFDTLAETKSGEFRDKISVNVVDTLTRANNRVQLSGGQTRIIDIATILTLGDLQSRIQGVTINILLFDEIFDSLDEENIGYVSRVLNQIKNDKSIYLISHRHVDQLEADQVLNFQT